MKRRRIALLMTSVFLLGNLSIACSSKSESTSTAGNTSVIVASGSEATTTEGSSEETTTTLATEMSTRNADDGTGHGYKQKRAACHAGCPAGPERRQDG